MFQGIKYWWQEFILRQFHKHYTVGGHCGLCGNWVENAVVDKGWEWTICDVCVKKYS